MRMWFRPVKGIAFCIVAAFFGSQAMAQVQVKRSFPSAKRISAFDNTTFLYSFPVGWFFAYDSRYPYCRSERC